jgi:hypothetical protein
MAGVYGKLNSRADYYRTLDEALATADYYLSFGPNPPIELIKTQLSAMKQWTANGRAPLDDEKDQVDVGVIALREVKEGNPGDQRADEWASQLTALDAYFEGWPSDDLAAAGPRSELDRVIQQRTMRKYFPKKK